MLIARRRERYFSNSKYVAEFWNTISNLPFILIGSVRLCEKTELVNLYWLMIGAGIASGIHHMMVQKWTIILDWIPMVLSVCVLFKMGVFHLISYGSWMQVIIALLVLYMDHIHQLMPVPWGHVCWHLLAAFATDNVYQDIECGSSFRTNSI
jgi:hypothetical protein